jgi:hypothetical protein
MTACRSASGRREPRALICSFLRVRAAEGYWARLLDAMSTASPGPYSVLALSKTSHASLPKATQRIVSQVTKADFKCTAGTGAGIAAPIWPSARYWPIERFVKPAFDPHDMPRNGVENGQILRAPRLNAGRVHPITKRRFHQAPWLK